jgi:hypothetical protein
MAFVAMAHQDRPDFGFEKRKIGCLAGRRSQQCQRQKENHEVLSR